MTKSMPVALSDNGKPPKIWVAVLNYEFVDGHHVFSSKDIAGLLIASKDAKKALCQIEPTIQALIQHNLGQNVDVRLGQDFHRFAREFCGPAEGTDHVGMRDAFAIIQAAA